MVEIGFNILKDTYMPENIFRNEMETKVDKTAHNKSKRALIRIMTPVIVFLNAMTYHPETGKRYVRPGTTENWGFFGSIL